MGEIIEINGIAVKASPMVAWAHGIEQDWRKFRREKRARIRKEEKAKSP